jgi:hypothetical protein
MNPQSTNGSQSINNATAAACGSLNSEPSTLNPGRRRGRLRLLDEVKRSEICALVAGGFSRCEAARYVACSAKTIQREAARNPDFQAKLLNSEMYAQMNPLRAIHQAAGTHWRAAAWILERAYPDRYGRRHQNALNAKEARQLYSEVERIISSEVRDPFQFKRIEKRLRVTFDYLMHAAGHSKRASRHIREAIALSEVKEQLNDPLAALRRQVMGYADTFRNKPQPSANDKKPTTAQPADKTTPANSASTGPKCPPSVSTPNTPTDKNP